MSKDGEDSPASCRPLPAYPGYPRAGTDPLVPGFLCDLVDSIVCRGRQLGIDSVWRYRKGANDS